MTTTVEGVEVDSENDSFTMTPEDDEWDMSDVELTADGQWIEDGDTNSYSHSGNILTVTDDEGTETFTCTVTSTSLTVIGGGTEEETIDYNGQEGILTQTFNMTINSTRQ